MCNNGASGQPAFPASLSCASAAVSVAFHATSKDSSVRPSVRAVCVRRWRGPSSARSANRRGEGDAGEACSDLVRVPIAPERSIDSGGSPRVAWDPVCTVGQEALKPEPGVPQNL